MQVGAQQMPVGRGDRALVLWAHDALLAHLGVEAVEVEAIRAVEEAQRVEGAALLGPVHRAHQPLVLDADLLSTQTKGRVLEGRHDGVGLVQIEAVGVVVPQGVRLLAEGADVLELHRHSEHLLPHHRHSEPGSVAQGVVDRASGEVVPLVVTVADAVLRVRGEPELAHVKAKRTAVHRRIVVLFLRWRRWRRLGDRALGAVLPPDPLLCVDRLRDLGRRRGRPGRHGQRH